MAFDASRLRFGDLIAAGGAVVLFISLFLDWYNVEFEGFGGIGGASEGGSAWQALSFLDILLLLIVLVVLAIVVTRALGVGLPTLPVPLSTVILAAGALATLIVLFRLIVSPVDVPGALDDSISVGRSIGIFLALLSALAITAGGFLSARERGDAIPGVGAGTGTGGGPLGGGPAGGGQPTGGQPAAGQPVGGQPGGPGAASAGPSDPGAQAGGQPKADWYPDPEGKARLRYWDGTQWTDQTAD